MTKQAKKLQRLRNNPKGDWTIEDLKTIAARSGAQWRQKGTSHVVFWSDASPEQVTVPAHRPIKPVYIKAFVAFIDAL